MSEDAYLQDHHPLPKSPGAGRQEVGQPHSLAHALVQRHVNVKAMRALMLMLHHAGSLAGLLCACQLLHLLCQACNLVVFGCTALMLRLQLLVFAGQLLVQTLQVGAAVEVDLKVGGLCLAQQVSDASVSGKCLFSKCKDCCYQDGKEQARVRLIRKEFVVVIIFMILPFTITTTFNGI